MSSFSKEERVAFEDIIEGFNDQLVLSKQVSIYNQGSDAEMDRANDLIWRPQPYIAVSYSGMDQTGNFRDYTQLSVPASIGFARSVPWTMDAKELRDALQANRLGDAAKQRLASDINSAIMNVAAYQGTLVVKRTTAASGYEDAAQCDAIMNEQGVQSGDRTLCLSTRDYNGMAANLAAATRSFGNPKSDKAYERSYVGPVAGFDTFKLDYSLRLPAALTQSVTVNGANQTTTPRATSTATTGETSNVDNRGQNLAVTVGAGGTIKVGDCFTIANVNAVHHITKTDTGQLKTFRVISIVSGSGGTGTIQIYPAIVTTGEYQNVTAAPASGAALTFLNTVAANINPFFHKDALELLPARYAVDPNSGLAVMRAATDQGIEVVMTKQTDINGFKTKFRVDVLFGVVNKQPQMSGIMLFSQT